MNSVASATAGAELPAMGRKERFAAGAGRASDRRCVGLMVFNAFTVLALVSVIWPCRQGLLDPGDVGGAMPLHGPAR